MSWGVETFRGYDLIIYLTATHGGLILCQEVIFSCAIRLPRKESGTERLQRGLAATGIPIWE